MFIVFFRMVVDAFALKVLWSGSIGSRIDLLDAFSCVYRYDSIVGVIDALLRATERIAHCNRYSYIN